MTSSPVVSVTKFTWSVPAPEQSLPIGVPWRSLHTVSTPFCVDDGGTSEPFAQAPTSPATHFGSQPHFTGFTSTTRCSTALYWTVPLSNT